ncbi:TonB-dependent receptor [Pelomonas sp. APW6]|uniref:TonB-dependent receptor n=1 Tax=Roseateles subflavus TaxID=3053353 RepID=A0ABT7LNN6_9BURK|nr:TonB-dependent receptor [Pelomonas sp. APW6]MDL5034489.1 TonB-dependent receptor [Pelomonas sp. APW6]
MQERSLHAALRAAHSAIASVNLSTLSRPLTLRPTVLVLSLMAAALAHAEGSTADRQTLDTVQVTGNPLGNKELAQPGQSLSGDALLLRRGASLGETVEGLPGVAATSFGPNASRPTIRGLDGERVRMLNNAGASLDVSSLSYDHAVPVDPLVVDRVEVLRGAAALLYGGNAIGGVVNTIDNRIPRSRAQGLSGAVDLRLGGASGERAVAAVLDGGQGPWAWHADVSRRLADDQKTPAFTSPDGLRQDRVRNSASAARSAALGGAWVGQDGYAGLSFDDYRNDYGVTVEPDVKIAMQRQRVAGAGEQRWQSGFLRKVQWQFSRARYQHDEIEGDGSLGTRFSQHGSELRVQAEHAPLAGARGVLGWQLENSRFEVQGEEALMPGNRSRAQGLFILEQWSDGPWQLGLGARRDQVRVRSDGDAVDAEEPRFGEGLERRFSPKSGSASVTWHPVADLGLSLNVNHSERAPSAGELFAKGVHVATGAFEQGDATLGLEHASGLDLGLHWKHRAGSIELNAYRTRFKDYIALRATGATVPGEGAERLPVYAYQAVGARLQGLELNVQQDLEMRWLPGTLGGWHWQVGLQMDWVRGDDLSHGEPLPRIAPRRTTLSLEGQGGPWGWRLEIQQAATQARVPSEDRATPGYTVAKLALNRQFRWEQMDALWYLKLDNLGNTLAYRAASMPTIRDWAPLPGRSLSTGVQLRF